MAQRAYPLDNTNYYADDVRLFHAGRTGGIVNSTGEDFAVNGVSGFRISIGKGVAFLKTGLNELGGVVYENDSDLTLTFEVSSSQKRYDYVAIRYDQNSNSVSLISVRGSNQLPTSPVRTNAVWELILYIVEIPANASGLTSGNVIDRRMNEDLCGLSVDTLTKIPTSQYENQFDDFMASIRKTLAGDTAGKLKIQIDAVDDDLQDYIVSNNQALNSVQSKANSAETKANANATNISNLSARLTTTENTLNARLNIRSISSNLKMNGTQLDTRTPAILYGTSEPSASTLSEGQIYLQIE